MKNVNSLAFHIELNRQRLDHAIKTKNDDLLMRTQLLLTQLHAAYFNETVKPTAPVIKRQVQEQFYLVFSDANQDGQVLSASAYRALYKTMSHFDRETHQAIPVDADISEEVAIVLTDEEDTGNEQAS